MFVSIPPSTTEAEQSGQTCFGRKENVLCMTLHFFIFSQMKKNIQSFLLFKNVITLLNCLCGNIYSSVKVIYFQLSINYSQLNSYGLNDINELGAS